MNDQTAPLDGIRFFTTSWDPEHLDFPAEADFQTGIGDWILRGELDEPADALMGGKPAPRIWLLLHEPGQGRLAAVTALALARELMGRDQAVLVLDCDEEQALLTGWADRHEQEGWIDLARYGASLLTCGERLPFPGRKGLLLGPGSYRPVDAQPAEVEQLLSNLRRQADDILLCCPIGEIGRVWAKPADLRLLCWDLAAGGRDRVGPLAAGLSSASTPLSGVITFGEESAAGEAPVGIPQEEIDEAPQENREDLPDESANVSEDEPDPLAALVESDSLPEAGAEDEDEDEETEEEEIDRAADRIAPVGTGAPDADLYARKRGTSRVFWWIALGAIALIAGSFWYYRQYVVVEPLEPGVTVAQTPGRTEADGADGEAETAQESGNQADELVADAAGTGRTETGPAAAGPGQDMDGQDMDGQDIDGQEADASIPPQGIDAVAGDTQAQESEPADSAAEPAGTGTATGTATESTPPPAESGFFMDPYLVPVGEDGWALHIYSFPDSATASRELEVLHRRGFQTAVRTVQIKGKGRWERIYLGSFSSKDEAQEALDPLLQKLGEDWGRPTEF